MKIALLMFGLVRDSSQTLQRFSILKDTYLKGFKVDIFCVTNTIAGIHDWSRGKKHINETDPVNLEVIFSTIAPKKWLALEYPDELKDTSELVSELSKRFPTPDQPIQNTVSKWHKLALALNLCPLTEYDIIMCCRMDCQFIHKFSHEQLMLANKLHTLSPLWAGKSSHLEYERSDENSIWLTTQIGYPDDFFYGPPHSISVFGEMPLFLRDLTPEICPFHPETVYTNFLRFKKIQPELIRWSRRISEEDFFKASRQIINVGHTYPPEMTTEWIAKIL